MCKIAGIVSFIFFVCVKEECCDVVVSRSVNLGQWGDCESYQKLFDTTHGLMGQPA